MSTATPSRINRRLGLSALALGVLALFGGPRDGAVAHVDTTDLARMVAAEVDHVEATELAGWIIEGRADYRLIDLRDPEAFGRYHIPTAESVAITELADADLLRNETIVLYSAGGVHSAQAWFLMQAHGYRATYMLLGGMSAWQDEVLFPVTGPDASAETRAAAASISAHFGGTVRDGAGVETGGTPTMALPVPELPEAGATVPRRPKRSSREGC